jgi:mediator of replication checkpoint protein 1
VSFLIDEPHSIPESQFSASEGEDEEEPTRDARASRPIIDRLTLSRSNSAAEATSGSMAFHAPSAGAHPGFRVPSLIRRATSNLSAKGSTTGSTNSSGNTTPVEGPQGVRRGGSGKSNIHYQAREAERRAALEKSDKRRRESIRKKAVKASRRGLSVLGNLDSGFE